jgi:hypothetical protein
MNFKRPRKGPLAFKNNPTSDAANTMKPALNDFYGSLSSEQEARSNHIGGVLAQSGNQSRPHVQTGDGIEIVHRAGTQYPLRRCKLH